MTVLDLDLENESLKETPLRLAKMYVHELFSGLQPEAFPKLTRMPNEMGYDQMIIVRKVKVMSVCEHHFATIDGEATVAYIPKDWVIGLSKINRVVDYFSRRPQVQERLTKQIADCLESALETQHVAVHIRAKHHCVASRGVQDVNSVTSTCDLRGDFRIRAETRAEFLGACVTEGR
jgi:GTP cyclohydrolase I